MQEPGRAEAGPGRGKAFHRKKLLLNKSKDTIRVSEGEKNEEKQR